MVIVSGCKNTLKAICRQVLITNKISKDELQFLPNRKKTGSMGKKTGSHLLTDSGSYDGLFFYFFPIFKLLLYWFCI